MGKTILINTISRISFILHYTYSALNTGAKRSEAAFHCLTDNQQVLMKANHEGLETPQKNEGQLTQPR